MPDIKQPAYEIEISNAQQCLAVNEDILREVALRTLSLEQIREAEISIAVIDNEQIWELNRRYLQHDYPTDVLSFPLDSEIETQPGGGRTSLPGRGLRIGGEVIVSAEMAVQRAPEFKGTPRDELLLYLVHGLLHLCGYDDRAAEDRAAMRGRERVVLAAWDIEPHGAEANSRSVS